MLHQQSGAIGALRREQQMHMVGHESVGMHRAFERIGQLAQMREVARVVVIGKEAGPRLLPR
jgi:hypothetical protein